jgi:transposase
MVRKNYSDEFRRQAVELLGSTPGATVRGIAGDLGIARGTLTQWARQFGVAPVPVLESAPVPGVKRESQAARVARLEAELIKVQTERDILRQAAKYFAGETNW